MKKIYWPLWLMLLIFSMPGIYACYFNYMGRPTLKTTIKDGYFINPSINVISLKLLPTQNKWQIVYWEPELCTNGCLQQKTILQNIQIALGRQKDRLAITAIKNYDLFEKLNLELNNLIIVDPLGNAILYYPKADLSILKGIRTLLKHTHPPSR